MDMTTPAPKKGILASSEGFDWGGATGGMQGATSWSPSENAQASSQLAKILKTDSPLMQMARSGAERAASRRGLLSSSISAGAGVEAMTGAATPIAQADANTFAMSERDAAQAANDFGRDANNFGRQRAMTQYQGILARESQDADQTFRSGQNALDRDFTTTRDNANRSFTTSEREGAQTFSAGQTALDRGFTLSRDQSARDFTTSERSASERFVAANADRDRTFQADMQAGRITADAVQNQLNRDQQSRIQELTEQGTDRRQAENIAAEERRQREQNVFSASENRVNRDASAGENALNRTHNEAITRLGSQLNQDAAKANIPQNMVADMSARMSDAVRSILADPNMDGPAKDAAIGNYYKYANSQMQWMSSFYSTTMPNFMGGGDFKPPGPTVPGAPAVQQPSSQNQGAAPAPPPPPPPPPPVVDPEPDDDRTRGGSSNWRSWV